MLEVVFSDSVAGAMLVAIGHQHSVGGATAVIFANEDGEQNATIPQAEIEKFQREAEERERRGWENAVPFEGKRENIVNLPLALSVGHISQTGIGTEREEAISLLTGTFPDIASQVVEEMLDTARKSYAELQPEKTLTGAVKGVTVEQVKELKAAVIRGAAAEQKVRELKVENQQLQQKIPSTKEKLKEAQERQRLENENRQLKVQVEYLEEDLSRERGISARLQEGIGVVLDFLDRHLPEQFRPLVEKARELLPVPEVQQPEKEQERGHTWGGMEL